MRFLRILLLVVLLSAIAGVVASRAGALGYEDEPCPLTDPTDHQLKVCHPDAEVGKPYSLQIKGKGGCTPDFVRYDVVAGTLPPGLKVEPSTALVSGTPTQAGVFTFWLQVSDLRQSWCVDDKQSQWQFKITVLQGLQILQRQSTLTPVEHLRQEGKRPSMFRNAMPRYEILSEDALATLDGGCRRLVSDIGVEFGSHTSSDIQGAMVSSK